MAKVLHETSEETDQSAIDTVNRRLEEKGYMIKRDSKSGRFTKNEPVPDFKPLPNKGKPASEIIIEGRG